MGSRGTDLAHILMSFGDPGETFSDFEGPGERLEMCRFFRGTLESVRIEEIQPGEVNTLHLGVQGGKKKGVKLTANS